MGRRNERAVKTRLNRREQGAPRRKKNKAIPPVEITQLVMPDGQCGFQNRRRPKARFGTKEKATAALKQAQQIRARSGSTHVEKRIYRCPEGGCGGYHLTSREEYDEGAWKRRNEGVQ